MIKISIDTDNDAFEDNWTDEAARILRDIAEQLERGQPLCARDDNGNKVGTVTVTGKTVTR